MNVSPVLADYGRRQVGDAKQSQVSGYLGLQAGLALDRNTRRDAFRLRHQSYHSNGFIDAREDGEFSDSYDFSPLNTTIVLYDVAQPVASVRVCLSDLSSPNSVARDIPYAHVFPGEFSDLMQPSGRSAEITRLVRRPDQDQNQRLVFVLFRMVAFILEQHDPDITVSCVRTNHIGFYRRLGFEDIAGPKQHTGLKFMTNLMICRRDRYKAVQQAVPLLRISPAARDLYKGLTQGERVAVFGCD